jgi:hypothetical protein
VADGWGPEGDEDAELAATWQPCARAAVTTAGRHGYERALHMPPGCARGRVGCVSSTRTRKWRRQAQGIAGEPPPTGFYGGRKTSNEGKVIQNGRARARMSRGRMVTRKVEEGLMAPEEGDRRRR